MKLRISGIEGGALLSLVFLLLVGCGGGGNSTANEPKPTPDPDPSSITFLVGAEAGPGGTVEPASRIVNDGTATTFTVTPTLGYSIASVSGCGGSLSGGRYTTGPIFDVCTVIANFSVVEIDPTIGVSLVPQPSLGTPSLFYAPEGSSAVLFAATREITFDDGNQGLWRSTDGGGTWVRVLDGAGGFLHALSDDPAFIIAGRGRSYALSEDAGQSWTMGEIRDVVFGDPMPLRNAGGGSADKGIFLISGGSVVPGLRRSLDRGDTWQGVLANEETFFLEHVVVAPSDPNVVYALTLFDFNIWKSTNGGSSFFSIKSGVSVDPFVFGDGIRVNPRNPDQIIISKNVSVNGGANWSSVPDISPLVTFWYQNRLFSINENTMNVSDDLGINWVRFAEMSLPGGKFVGGAGRFQKSGDSMFFSSGAEIYRFPLSAMDVLLNE